MPKPKQSEPGRLSRIVVAVACAAGFSVVTVPAVAATPVAAPADTADCAGVAYDTDHAYCALNRHVVPIGYEACLIGNTVVAYDKDFHECVDGNLKPKVVEEDESVPAGQG
ncbi:hypothetical protein AB0J38_33890 [Streptomyces sp. NPDC050095]|uniref:hypothetical protein n=1 Tax=unclassified Streptomyces TaxID=2593676 RepID=UPI0034122655